jgi:hypothetical protein
MQVETARTKNTSRSRNKRMSSPALRDEADSVPAEAKHSPNLEVVAVNEEMHEMTTVPIKPELRQGLEMHVYDCCPSTLLQSQSCSGRIEVPFYST